MAVFTPVTLGDLAGWITQFDLGRPLAIRPISSGIENSNAFLSTESGEYVLTIFEQLTFGELPFYLELMRHLARRGVPVPEPVPNRHGAILHTLHGKPCAIVSRLAGTAQTAPQAVHCATVGAMLARMHLAGVNFPLRQPNPRGPDWWRTAADAVLPRLPLEARQLLRAELDTQASFAASAACGRLPRGPVHADLFRDNVLFEGERLSGFLDFYFAGCDAWIFDVAVTVNDWCIDPDTGALDQGRLRALLAAYHAVRPFTPDEQAAWHTMLRAGALRFWLSRLYDRHFPRAATTLTSHDPRHFERILRQRIALADAGWVFAV
ncbi:MAG TPA: homoserine kinase [Telluria sp.]|nr:homoserine kinase [Telluria sp.]